MTIFLFKDSIISLKKYPKSKTNLRMATKAHKRRYQESTPPLISTQKVATSLQSTYLEKIFKNRMKKLIKLMSVYKLLKRTLKNLKHPTA